MMYLWRELATRLSSTHSPYWIEQAMSQKMVFLDWFMQPAVES
jgi:hypothetical protein